MAENSCTMKGLSASSLSRPGSGPGVTKVKRSPSLRDTLPRVLEEGERLTIRSL